MGSRADQGVGSWSPHTHSGDPGEMGAALSLIPLVSSFHSVRNSSPQDGVAHIQGERAFLDDSKSVVL